MDQEEIMQQLQAAVALHNQGELDQAEAIYRQILTVDGNNFYALRFLGCLQSSKGFYQSAISLLRKATVVSSEDSECWFNLGNAYKGATQLEEAIVSYRSAEEHGSTNPQIFNNWGRCLQDLSRQGESIPILEKAVGIDSDCFGAWFALGNSWRDVGDISRAVFCYLKSIDASPSFVEAYLNLGILLKEEGEVEEAIASYRKAIEVKPDFADAYLNLGYALKEKEEVEAATDAFSEHYRLKPIAQSFSFPPAVASQPLNIASEVKVPEGAEFIPSYVSDAVPFGMHLMYVHIPKAGGVRFSSPIFGCIQAMLLKGGLEKFRDLFASAFGCQGFAALASDRIDSAPMRDGIVAAFSSYDFPTLDFSFLTPHRVSSRELSLAMRDQFDVQPIRLATWRDPRKRLKSALDYLYRTSEGDLDLVREKIDQKDPFLDNAIYRGCFSDFSPQVSPDEQRDAQLDYLIDIGDFSVMNQIMSSFLSRCRLPNIVVNKKVNVTSADKRMDAGIAACFMEQCVEAGFISLDCASEIEQFVSKGLPAEFDLEVDPSSTSLHPLSFVVNAATEVKTSLNNCLLSTEYLLTEEGQEFLRKTFA
ncbi:lipopolysaccharide assembly protein LapB [Synechococcus sp. A18-25c]|uniref:tetratricopeptide repeat protein n=1 Tax=Synechococcus sp. A18-25c TaxID=1866938 RepID=UPI001647B481|nr:tetratricopeptide repeat protein [Synechococcus sp. A18-25c]